jgi:hypothetical protein
MGVMAEAAQFKQGTSYPRFFESVTATPGSLAPVRFSESESSQPGLRAWPQAQAANRAQSLIPGGSVTVPDHRIQIHPIAFLHSGDDSATRSTAANWSVSSPDPSDGLWGRESGPELV